MSKTGVMLRAPYMAVSKVARNRKDCTPQTLDSADDSMDCRLRHTVFTVPEEMDAHVSQEFSCAYVCIHTHIHVYMCVCECNGKSLCVKVYIHAREQTKEERRKEGKKRERTYMRVCQSPGPRCVEIRGRRKATRQHMGRRED